MTQYNDLNAKLPKSQLHKSKSGITNGTEVALKISSNMVILLMRIIFSISYYYLLHNF